MTAVDPIRSRMMNSRQREAVRCSGHDAKANFFVRSLMALLVVALTAMACADNDPKDSNAPLSSAAIAAATLAGGALSPIADVPPVGRSAESAMPIDALRSYCQLESAPQLRFDLSATMGWAVCNTGKAAGTIVEKRIYRTQNAGLSWTLTAKYDFGIQTPIAGVGEAPAATVTILVFQDESNGWMAAGGAGPGVYRTRDGGVSWSAVADLGSDIGVTSISFADAFEGAIVTRRSVWVTVDGGEHWTERP